MSEERYGSASMIWDCLDGSALYYEKHGITSGADVVRLGQWAREREKRAMKALLEDLKIPMARTDEDLEEILEGTR